jgi:hypothetical protein
MGNADGVGDWRLAQELFARGEPAFVDELRKVDDAEALGAFAARWLADTRPEARRLLLDYLDRPLNAFRHEALIKRLFKQAEAAGDDELMARFLVAFDRAVRRIPGRRSHFESQEVGSEREANELAAAWRDQGFESTGVYQNWKRRYHVWGRWFEPIVKAPRETTMPRGKLKPAYDPSSSWLAGSPPFSVPDWVYTLKLDPKSYRDGGAMPETGRKTLEKRRLFSLATRNYLRRRAWRYFRKLGRTQPERYVPAAVKALVQYRDEDVADGLALIDNWSLTHILFQFSPCLIFDDRACKVADGHTLAALEPAPKYAKLWKASPRALIDLLLNANCRTVRSWALALIRRDLAAFAPLFTQEEKLELLTRDDPDVVHFAADLLRADPTRNDIPFERWLRLLDNAAPAALDSLCELMNELIPPERATLGDAVKLALARPAPIARLGLHWLQPKTPQNEEECRAVRTLVEAECETVRPEILYWAVGVLSESEMFRSEWVLDWLDSRHADVRDSGWTWFQNDERVGDDVAIWQKLLETPYDDVRIALIADLDARTRGFSGDLLKKGVLDPELLRLLWASVLLNIHRGSRAKPVVLRQLVARIESRPAELPTLLPILAVALRSVRGPEFRAGLAAVVRLAGRDESIVAAFPELTLS